MRRIAVIFAALALIPALSHAAQGGGMAAAKITSAPVTPAGEGRVYVVSGSVFVALGENPAHRVTNAEPISSNSLISTGSESAALLKFADGQVVTMQSNSTFKVREYRYDAKNINNSRVVFLMLRGGMRFITGLIGQRKKDAFRLLTTHSTIGIRGTEFMVAMVDKSIYSQVLTGQIGMTNAAGTMFLGAGQTAVVASSGAAASLVSASAIPKGVFSELLSIPVQPSAISAPATPAATTPATATTTGIGMAPTGASTIAGTTAGAAATAGTSIPAAPAATAVGAATTRPSLPGIDGVPAGATAGAGMASSVTGAAIGIAGGALAALTAGADADDSSTAGIHAVSPGEAGKDSILHADDKSGMAVSGKAGTLGYGADLTFGSDRVSGRLGFNKYRNRYKGTANSLDFDLKLQMQTVTALADWYPFGGSFRISGGFISNKNSAEVNARPDASANFTINGTLYPAATAVRSLQGRISFKPAAPYLGIGWGNPVATGKGWGLVSDVGVLFQGTPQFSLTATCAPSLSAAQCAQLQADVAAERIKHQDDLDRSLKKWPVVSIGLSYQW